MEFCLNGGALTPKERNLLIRYCVNVATRGKCATKALLRPFKQTDLREAFAEQSRARLELVLRYARDLQEGNAEAESLLQGMPNSFGGEPTRDEYVKYCREIIKREERTVRDLKRMYTVCVNYAFVGKKWLAFHRSLHPRVTFGYSSLLHEACDFLFDDEKRAAFLRSSLAEPPQWKGDAVHDWGNVMFGNMQLFYEDLTLYRGDACILETISHEEMMTARLEEPDLSALAQEKGGAALVKKLRVLGEEA